ncbi:hypothetical protein ACJX0J_013612, partial [Zea mays]
SHANPFLFTLCRPFHTLHLACLPQTSGYRFRRRHLDARRSSTSLHGLLQAALLHHDPEDEHRLQRVLPADQEGAPPDG